MYFVISGLIGLSGYGLNRALMSAYIDRTGDEGQRQMISDVLSWAIQIAFGLLLAIGAKGLSGALYRLRHGNAAPAEGWKIRSARMVLISQTGAKLNHGWLGEVCYWLPS